MKLLVSLFICFAVFADAQDVTTNTSISNTTAITPGSTTNTVAVVTPTAEIVNTTITTPTSNLPQNST